MLTPTIPTTVGPRAQLGDSDEAVLRFAVTTRRPDRDVHPGDRAWWLATEERLEIRHELRASACSRSHRVRGTRHPAAPPAETRRGRPRAGSRGHERGQISSRRVRSQWAMTGKSPTRERTAQSRRPRSHSHCPKVQVSCSEHIVRGF